MSKLIPSEELPSETPANLFNWEQQSCKESDFKFTDFTCEFFMEIKRLHWLILI